MHTMTLVCPYCSKPLPDFTALREEVIADMPEEADRDFCATCSCGAWLTITPKWDVILKHKPIKRDPGRITYGKLLAEGKKPWEVYNTLAAAYPEAVVRERGRQ